MAVEKKKKSVGREYFEAIAIALLLAIFIRTFVVQAFKIPSGSMLPTLQIGDHLLVNKFIYGIRNPFSGKVIIPIAEPKREDIIVFKYPLDKNVDYIKRVIGTPGETVEIKNKRIYINNEPVADPHAHFTSDFLVPATAGPRDNFGPVKVPKGKLFVMGDNRDNSSDGRFWGFADEQDVLGKAFIIYWSWDLHTPLLSLQRFESIRWSRFGTLIH